MFLQLFAAPGIAAQLQTLRARHVPDALAGLTPLRRLESDKVLRLAIGLPLRNEADLDALLAQLHDPSSTNYHQWLTPEQFTERFGPAPEDYQALEDFAIAHGFKVTYRHPNRVLLDVEAAAKDVEAAFHLQLQVYQHPTEAREFFAPDAEPSLDFAIPVLDISGLDDFSIPKPQHREKPVPPAPSATPNAGSGPSGTYMGGDFRAAYVPGSALTGAGQSVGLLQFDGYYASDITSYESMAGLPNVNLVKVPVDGGVSTPGSGNSEVCLDIEMVMSMAPAISTIYVYEAPNPSPWPDLLSRMANDNLSRQLSCSWGGGAPDPTSEQIFKQMSAQGQSFYNASGDSDAFTSSIPFPSDSTNITQVGATTLTTTGPSGSYVSETVWNWGLVKSSYVGSSGGVSTYYGLPIWQQGISMVANQGSTANRNVPDVALTGDNVYVTYNNGSAAVFGGTSCAAPLWAGLTALMNQQAALKGSSSVGFVNPAIYAIGKGANYLNCFHDTTNGNNFSSSSPTKYSAVPGYDLCTGWGTPIGNGLITALTGPPAPLMVSNSFSITAESCANGVVDPGETVTVALGLKNLGSANTTNLLATLQASGGVTSPSAAQTYGALAAGGAAVTKAFTFTANGSCGGVLTASLQLQDGNANLGTVTFMIHLGQLVPGTTLTQNFDAVSTPTMPSGWTASLISGSQTAWVSSTGAADTAPNSAFAADSSSAGVNALVSPVIAIATASPQLTFSHNYTLEFHTKGRTTTYYDGGVLEIKIGNGAFTDIVAAGGSFVTGGYNCTLTSSTGNSFGGRQAWGGSSSGWTTTTVNLPAAAQGQNVQLRWVCSTDSGNSYTAVGWYVDTISLQDATYVCCTPNASTPPSISTQPTNQVAIAGTSTSFTVAATGTAPLQYQWMFANTSLPNGTNATLTILDVQPGQAGSYKVVITNSAGSATSLVATLTVLVPPSITLQPSNQTIIAGSAVALNAAAAGSTPLSYQWYLNANTPVGTNGPILGFSNAQPADEGAYRLVVTNAAGAVTSLVANLTVPVPPQITLHPSNQTVISGTAVALSAAASGSAPLTYQWYFNANTPVGTNGPVLGFESVQPTNEGAYVLLVTNAAGSATSVVANLTVLVPPTISVQPSNQTALLGSDVIFSALGNGSAPLSYQWYFNATNPVGTGADTLSLTNVQNANAGDYQLVVTNDAGAATSSVAALVLISAPVLLSPEVTSNGDFQFILSGNAGQKYSIEASTNLQDWEQVDSISNISAQTSVTETNASNWFRLYRARWVP